MTATSQVPRVSVVVAVFNGRDPLRVLLDSLCASRFQDFEVCACDDASTDGAGDVLAAYADRLQVRVVRNPVNRGVTASRNAAMALARGPLLLFLDSDVRIATDTIDRLIASMEATGADVVDGIYSSVALDDHVFSRYYALFAHHSFLIADHPIDYNVFNGFCALCRRQAMEATGGHAVLAKGVEVENESLGRRIVDAGFRIVLDPSIAVDHHWGGHRKLRFIFTRRIYWWVKVFFATGCRFESSLTTASYGIATLCAGAFVLALALTLLSPWFSAVALLSLLGFLHGYLPFLRFVHRRRGLGYAIFSALVAAYLALFGGPSAAFSAAQECLRWATGRGLTLDRGIFQAARP